MKTGFAFIVFALAVLSAGLVFAQANDPESYRQALLAPGRALQGGTAGFCQQKTNSQDSYNNCQVTLNFLLDINRSQVPQNSAGKDVCPRGATIDYAGNPANQAKITARCT